MATTTALLTVDEFSKLPDTQEQHVELVQGVVIYMAGGSPVHEIVKANLIEILRDWLRDHQAGKLFVETSYRLDEHNELIPDLSVLSRERLLHDLHERFVGAPDLAVEVVSSETAERLMQKIQLYLRHGSKSVWVVFPNQRLVEVYTDESNRLVRDGESLTEAAALPGFVAPVSVIFEGI